MGGGKPGYPFWYRMMGIYSRRKLTFKKDKLAALAGIVEEFGSLIGDTPAVGLWKGDMLEGLLWQTAEPTGRVDYLGALPSWSWASVDGPVSWERVSLAPSGILPQNQLQVISCEIDWAGPPMTSQVLDAKIKVRGRLKRSKTSKWKVEGGNSFHLHETDASAGELPQSSKAAAEKELSAAPEVLGYCYLEQVQPVNSHVWCLGVYSVSRRPESDQPRNHIHKVLILLPENETLTEFRQMGVGDMWSTSFKYDGNMGTAGKTFEDVQPRTISIT
jgi:hypothetical protein